VTRASTRSHGRQRRLELAPDGRRERRVRGEDVGQWRQSVLGALHQLRLELDETTGRLTGTLLKAGNYRIRVFAFSETGAPISKLFVIRVRA
jgi:hypothetical protein